MREKNNIAICITGWHFPPAFYAQISRLTQVDAFVISHKPRQAIPEVLVPYLDWNRVYFEANIGYDWGCYQQFLAKQFWRDYEYLFFIHDDVVIKDLAFIERCIALLDQGAPVIGNGRPGPKQPWPRLSPESYAHASWKPANDFEHDVVRGSFFSTKRQALEQLQHFEVFWDRFHVTSGFGNLSLKASCGKWAYYCGADCFQFLSEEYCTSEFLDEQVRGATVETPASLLSWRKRMLLWGLVRILQLYMSAYWRAKTSARWDILRKLLQPVINFIAAPVGP